jgi:4-amino-4-deoxy-L-arabinose transferase-like glycosyltransferase
MTPTARAASEPADLPRWLRGRAPLAILTLTSLPFLFYGLGSYSLVHGDEGVYHGIAREMATSGDWTQLSLFGKPRIYDRFMNAPLQYWARAALILAFGDNYWTMRALSAACALGTLLATYQLAKAIAGARAGLIAGLLLLGSYQFLYMHGARIGALEPAVCWCLSAIARRFLLAAQGRAGFAAHHAIAALLAQVKAPLVIVPFSAELALFACLPALRAQLGAWLRWLPLAAAGFAWHLFQLVELRGAGTDALARMFEKAGGTRTRAHSGFGARALLYARTLCYGSLPQILIAPFALSLAKRSAHAFDPRALAVIAAYPLALVAFFLSIDAAFDWYLLPLQPFAAVWLALFCERELRAPSRASAIAIGVTALASACISIREGNPFAERPWLAADALAWRFGDGASAALGAAVAIGLCAAIAARAWLRLSERTRARLPRALAALLIAGALLRSALPLRFVETRSELETLAAQLRATRAHGDEFAFPIPIREEGLSRARFYFGADYQIQIAEPNADGVHYWLVGRSKSQ